jgi:hypothetical protein
MAVNLAALKVEIALPAYNGMSDAVIAAAINAATVPGFNSVSPVDAKNALMFTASNDWGWLQGVAAGYVTSANASGGGGVAVATTTPWATRRAAATIYDLFRGEAAIPMNSARAALVSSALGALVTANVITAAGRTAVEAIPQTNTPKWRQFSDRELDYNDIAQARAS